MTARQKRFLKSKFDPKDLEKATFEFWRAGEIKQLGKKELTPEFLKQIQDQILQQSKSWQEKLEREREERKYKDLWGDYVKNIPKVPYKPYEHPWVPEEKGLPKRWVDGKDWENVLKKLEERDKKERGCEHARTERQGHCGRCGKDMRDSMTPAALSMIEYDEVLQKIDQKKMGRRKLPNAKLFDTIMLRLVDDLMQAKAPWSDIANANGLSANVMSIIVKAVKMARKRAGIPEVWFRQRLRGVAYTMSFQPVTFKGTPIVLDSISKFV
jgi:hypothetical protein